MSDASSLSTGKPRVPEKTRTRTDSLRLGRTFRSILLSPRAGYESALKIGSRRERVGETIVEGHAPVIFSAVGGVTAMLLWLKLGGLLTVREAGSAEFRWTYLVAAAVVGGTIGVATQRAWARLAFRMVESLRGSAAQWQLRMVWGASAFPQIVALTLLLPLDLAITGPRSYTTDRLAETYQTIWAALSISLSVTLVVWSVFLLYRGVETASGLTRFRSFLVTMMGVILLMVLFAVPITVPYFL